MSPYLLMIHGKFRLVFHHIASSFSIMGIHSITITLIMKILIFYAYIYGLCPIGMVQTLPYFFLSIYSSILAVFLRDGILNLKNYFIRVLILIPEEFIAQIYSHG